MDIRPNVMDFMKSHNIQLVNGIVNLYETKQLTDFTLIADNVELPCHRVVLAACSPYFRAMFSNQLQEATEGKATLYDVDPTVLSIVMDYMYKGTIHLTANNVQGVFTASSLFEMIGLQSSCALFMISELDFSNCVELYQFGSFHSCEALKVNSKAYVVGNFSELGKGQSLMKLEFCDFRDLIADDDLNVEKEDKVYEITMKWIETDIESRRRCLPALFKSLRLVFVSESFMDKEICSNELVMSEDICRSFLTDTKHHKLSDLLKEASVDNKGVSIDTLPNDINITPRLGMFNRKMLVFVGGHDKESRALTCFDPLNKRNYYAIPLHVTFDFKYRIDYHRAVVTSRNEVFLVGGIFYEDHHFEEEGTALKELRQFDPVKKCWVLCAPLLSARCAHTVVTHGQHIYALGGMSTFPIGEPLCSVEKYSIDDDEWSYASPMPKRLYHHCSVIYQDSIIVIGGMSLNGEVTKSFFEYNINRDSWAVIENTMAVPRADFGSAILGNKLYVIAGASEQFKVSSVEVCDLERKRWRFCPDFYEDRKSMAVVAFNDSIYLCGGVRTLISRATGQPRIVETKDLWKYDPQAQLWSKEAKLVQYANIHACVVAVMNMKCLHESEFVSSG